MGSGSFRRESQCGVCRGVMAGLAIALTAGLVPAAIAEPLSADHPHSARSGSFTHGEVRLVDRPAGRIVLRHGPIENLGVPPMTMIFRVRDARHFDGLDSGAPVRFVADRLEGAFTIIHIERR